MAEVIFLHLMYLHKYVHLHRLLKIHSTPIVWHCNTNDIHMFPSDCFSFHFLLSHTAGQARQRERLISWPAVYCCDGGMQRTLPPTYMEGGGRGWLENSLMEADKGRTPCGRNKGLKKETETEWRYTRRVEGRRSPVRCSERRQQGWSWRWRDEVVLLFPAGLGCGHHWPGDLKCTVLLWVLPHSLHSVCQVFSRVRCLVSGRGSARVRPNADLIYCSRISIY